VVKEGVFMMGRVAVVTGGSRGIGFAVAVRFLREGVHVAVLDIRDEGGEHLAAVGHKSGARFLHVTADVSSCRQVQEAGDKVREEFGRLDIWVNNAGWDRISSFLSTAPSDWEKVVGINLMGTVHGTRVALEGMLDGKDGGAIVNVASDAGRVGSSGEAVYSAAKGGVIAFTKAIAREVARQNIRVNCVCPGGGRCEDHRGDAARHPLQAARGPGGDCVGDPVPCLGRGLLHHGAGLERERGLKHGGVDRRIGGLEGGQEHRGI
jgi:2-hydroxycyclohexanecarboxyl-CoA dehydrogenase